MPIAAMIGQVCERTKKGFRNGFDYRMLNRCPDWNCNKSKLSTLTYPDNRVLFVRILGIEIIVEHLVPTLVFVISNAVVHVHDVDENFTAAKSSALRYRGQPRLINHEYDVRL